MNIGYRVAKRFEQQREKLIADFLTGLGNIPEDEAAFHLSNEYGLNVHDARDLIEEYRALDTGVVPKHILMPLVSKYATLEKVGCGCGCGCDCYNGCNCECECR